MNVFDFDKTIYDGDCTVDFYMYCLKKYPVIYKKRAEQYKKQSAALWFVNITLQNTADNYFCVKNLNLLFHNL